MYTYRMILFGKNNMLIINIYMERKCWEESQLNVSLVISGLWIYGKLCFSIFIFQISYTSVYYFCVIQMLAFLKIRF